MEDLIEALQIFLKYGNSWYPTSCGLKELYSNDRTYTYIYLPILFILGIDASVVSAIDEFRLSMLGFLVDEDDNSFFSYRFANTRIG